MKISEISYRALRTGHGYNNTSVEAKTVVDENVAPEQALAELRAWVDGQVDEQLKRHDLFEKIADLNDRAGRALRDAERYEARAEAAKAFIRECRDLADIARKDGKGGIALTLENLL